MCSARSNFSFMQGRIVANAHSVPYGTQSLHLSIESITKIPKGNPSKIDRHLFKTGQTVVNAHWARSKSLGNIFESLNILAITIRTSYVALSTA